MSQAVTLVAFCPKVSPAEGRGQQLVPRTGHIEVLLENALPLHLD